MRTLTEAMTTADEIRSTGRHGQYSHHMGYCPECAALFLQDEVKRLSKLTEKCPGCGSRLVDGICGTCGS